MKHVNPYMFPGSEPVAAVQVYADLSGRKVVIGRKGDPDREFYLVTHLVEADDRGPRRWRLEPLGKGGKPIFKTDAELAALEAREMFRLAVNDPGDVRTQGRRASIALIDPALAKGPRLKLYWARLFMEWPGFALSERQFDAFMKEEQGKKNAPRPISFATFYRYYRENQESLWTDPEWAGLSKSGGAGRPRDPWGLDVARLVEEALERVAPINKPTGENVRDELISLARANGIAVDRLPSLRTIQERLKEIPIVTKDILHIGYEKALAKHGHREVRALPNRPLEVCETDEVQLDLEVVDDDTLIPIGRPWLSIIRDRKSGIILSAVLCAAPSFEVLVESIKMAIYPKHMSAYEGVEFPWFGRMEALVTDAAKYNRGDSVSHLRAAIGIDFEDLQPGRPWRKGGLESLNGFLNRTISHNLPGAVMGNPKERQEHEDARDLPMIKLSELRFLIFDWICNHHNVKEIEGLGAFRTMKDVPNRVWDRLMPKSMNRAPMDPEIFDRFMGKEITVTIDKDGIRHSYLRYWSDDLHTIIQHPDHKPGRGKHGGTRYRAVLIPGDSSKLIVLNPYNNDAPIHCEVVPTQRQYARGLPRNIHQMFVDNYNKTLKEDPSRTPDLRRQKSKALEVAIRVAAARKKVRLDEFFQTYMKSQRSSRIASEVRPATYSPAASAEMIDVRNPVAVPPTEPMSFHAPPAPWEGALPGAAPRRKRRTPKGIETVDPAIVPPPAIAGSEPTSRLTVDLDSDLSDL